MNADYSEDARLRAFIESLRDIAKVLPTQRQQLGLSAGFVKGAVEALTNAANIGEANYLPAQPRPRTKPTLRLVVDNTRAKMKAKPVKRKSRSPQNMPEQ